MIDVKQRNALTIGIILHEYPDFYDWPEERRVKAIADLWDEALDAGLKHILDTIQMFDDMAKEQEKLIGGEAEE